MPYDPELAAIRFGCGLSPGIPAPGSADQMLAQLQGPDLAAQHFPIAGATAGLAAVQGFRQMRKEARRSQGTPEGEQSQEAFRRYRRRHLQQRDHWFRQLLLRQITTRDGLRERLTLFWADHFTAQGKGQAMRPLGYGYVESAIRPNITGRFEDLLIAAVTSPLMLHYLDQTHSRGAHSQASRRQGGRGGLNENLAREVLELHTLGVNGPYSQADVGQLAELFTGLSYRVKSGFVFRRALAEPGAEQVLGQSYGGDTAGLEPVLQALRDLARHPATADHIAWKLAVHFTRDAPDPALVADLAASYRNSGGDLGVLYERLLTHPLAWEPGLQNVKPPFDFIASSCRALALSPAALSGLNGKRIRQSFLVPLKVMGQNWQAPSGPDGWDEADEAWITPQGLSARLRWSMSAPSRLLDTLPDPDAFARQSLGARADVQVRFVASAAETRAEAIGLVLCAPGFQRR